MDNFNIIWLTLWSDCFMTQYQHDLESKKFIVPVKVATDFLFYLSEMLGYKKEAHYDDEEKEFVAVELSADEIEGITSWIIDFNHSTRKPLGLIMPDLYLDEETISLETAILYWNRTTDFLAYMIENQNKGRDEVAKWAMDNFNPFYLNVYSEALKAKKSR